MNYTDPNFRISGRTNDETHPSATSYIMHGIPRGRQAMNMPTKWISKYGYVSFTPLGEDTPDSKTGINPFDFIEEGLNEKGLSCGLLFLADTEYQKPDPHDMKVNVPAYALCKWALENFELVSQVHSAMPPMRFHSVPGGGGGQHMVVQDRAGQSLTVEFLNGVQVLHLDRNDGIDGFGIMTNQPPMTWQIQNIKALEFKRKAAGSSVAIPGDFYPDERYLRLHLIRQGIESANQPTTYREAVASAVAVLNTVTIPAGALPGTDAKGDHTQWGVIRDHLNAAYYLRSESNPSFRKITLTELDFRAGAAVTTMEVEDGPWFMDATRKMQASVIV